MPGLRHELRGDQRLLVELRAFQRALLIAVIGHRIHAVLIEEQLVEFAGKPIMVDDIAARPAAEIHLIEPRAKAVEGALQAAWRLQLLAGPVGIAHHQQHHVANVVRRLDDQPSVHIGLACGHARIARDIDRHALVGQADAQRRGCGIAIAVFLAVMISNNQQTLADQLSQHFVEQPHGREFYGLAAGRQAVILRITATRSHWPVATSPAPETAPPPPSASP